MLNKKENDTINKVIIKNSRQIYSLIKNNNIKDAFIKYETTRDFLEIFNKLYELDEHIIYRLQKEYSNKSIDLFMQCFKSSYTNYKENEFGIVKNVLEEIKVS